MELSKILSFLQVSSVIFAFSTGKILRKTRENIEIDSTFVSRKVTWTRHSAECSRRCLELYSHLGPTIQKFDSKSNRCDCFINSFPENNHNYLRAQHSTYTATGPTLSGKELPKDFSFAQFCPCLNSVSKAFDEVYERDAEACGKICSQNKECVAFKFCNQSLRCSWFRKLSIFYDLDHLSNGLCSHEDTNSTEHFYQLKKNSGLTYDCAFLKQEDPSLREGYYDIKIRGRNLPVYCTMGDDARTYINVSGYSVYGGSEYNPTEMYPSQKVTRNWSKVRLVLDECVVLIVTEDSTFSSWDYHDNSNFQLTFAKGNTCGGPSKVAPAAFSVDLSRTPFHIAANVAFKVYGHLHWTALSEMDANRQLVTLEGFGHCGEAVPVRADNGQAIGPFLPVIFDINNDL